MKTKTQHRQNKNDTGKKPEENQSKWYRDKTKKNNTGISFSNC